ncbi:hypothetical protein V6N12_008672 [Hibiscus sabdariffa]|uniref:Uncharacterized protein n=1 Tax=Hibiscus sabdariffa TaxID=183260 RepID=A0ABR1ZJU8_9ROSI
MSMESSTAAVRVGDGNPCGAKGELGGGLNRGPGPGVGCVDQAWRAVGSRSIGPLVWVVESQI